MITFSNLHRWSEVLAEQGIEVDLDINVSTKEFDVLVKDINELRSRESPKKEKKKWWFGRKGEWLTFYTPFGSWTIRPHKDGRTRVNS